MFRPRTTIQINLWSIIAIIILGTVISTIAYYSVAALKTKFFWWKQIVVGFIKVILPLVILYAITSWLATNVAVLKEVLLITIGFEAIAIIVNPFPQWCFENNVEGLVEISDRIFNRNAEGE